MAKIVLGLASSHSTMAHAPSSLWDSHVRGFDMNQSDLVGLDGRLYDYASLLKAADPSIGEKARQEHFPERHARIQVAIAKLAETFAAVAPDIAVIVGEDQREVFQDENMPALLVYWGNEIPNIPRKTPITVPPLLQESLGSAAWAYGTEEHIYPVNSDLGLHLIHSLVEEEFDVSHARRITRPCGIGHAFAFVYHRIMKGKVVPHVPVILNTYYPPNQMTPKRSYKVGQVIRRAIESWPSDLRVAVIASGGLSHFVVNEELDSQVIEAMQKHDAAALCAIPRKHMNSGSSEIMNWIAAASALDGLEMKLVDYVPCYRSPAGTGVGMGFATWS